MKTRAEKVAHELQREIAAIVRDDVQDPRIGFVTITRVHITDDLGSARVWFSSLGTASQRKGSLIGLQRAVGFVRKLVAERMKLRIVPEIVFEYDASLEAGNDVLTMLDALKTGQSKPA